MGYPNISNSRLDLLSPFREKHDYFLQYLGGIFKFGCFSWYHACIFEKNESEWCRIQSWVDYHQFQIPKMKNQKVSMSFSNFHFETNLIKWRFFIFYRPFWTVGKFPPSRSEAEKLAGSDKRTNFFIHLYFWGRNLLQINIKKKLFLIRLDLSCDSSSAVFIRPDYSSSDSFTFVYIRLMTCLYF